MSKPSALVTGGCGFVGRHFIKWLLENDYSITVVDNLSTGLLPELWPTGLRVPASREKDIRFIFNDFRAFAEEAQPAFDLIVHLAAVVGGRLTIEGDPLAVATDLAIDATFFNWAVKHPVRPSKVFYFSSSAAYPIAHQTAAHNHPLSEDLINFDADLGLPDMTYGWAKLTGEFLARHAVATYGLDVAIFRPFSGYGEDQDFSYPFTSIVRRVARHESPIAIWGSGQQLRDFIHIDDIVNAVFASSHRMRPGEALNLGSGQGISFFELAKRACTVIGHHAEIACDSTKPEGVFARVGNCERMFRNYRPSISLEEGISRVYLHQIAMGLVEPIPIAPSA